MYQKYQPKKSMKKIIIGFLVIMSLMMLWTAPNTMASAVFLFIAWSVGYVISKITFLLIGVFGSDMTVTEVLEQEQARRRQEQLPPPKPVTLDTEKLTPLTDTEAETWNEMIARWEDKQN